MPYGDRDVSTIFLEYIIDRDPDNHWYCNPYELDEDLLDGPKVKPIVEQSLLKQLVTFFFDESL